MATTLRFGAVTNRETWIDRVQVADENGVPFDLSGGEFRLEVQARPSGARVLAATTGDGTLAVREDGILEWTFDVARLRPLSPGLYAVGLAGTLEGVQRQIFTGTLEIEDGYLS